MKIRYREDGTPLDNHHLSRWKRFFCKRFGHKWFSFRTVPGLEDYEKDMCNRCGLYNYHSSEQSTIEEVAE